MSFNKGILRLFTGLFILFLVVGCGKSPEVKAKEHLEKGSEYLKADKTKEAVIELMNAVKLDSKNAAAHHSLALAYIKTGGQANLTRPVQYGRASHARRVPPHGQGPGRGP